MTLRLVEAACPLALVGHLEVPRSVERHYYFAEAFAGAQVLRGHREPVIGTSNVAGQLEPVVEFYGWGGNVPPHTDGFGWVYFMPIRFRLSRVSAAWGRRGVDLWLRRGGVYRLDDRVSHWTKDAGAACCLYVGIFKRHEDDRAIAMLKDGVRLLARKSRAAPRVKMGFRAPAAWECHADTPTGKVIIPTREARRRGYLIAECAFCRELAYALDQFWPYHQERNRCRAHLDIGVENVA